ncbi:MAG TPA: efflux RND transporter periplasmic adaptor subunit [Candidatus Polarisedimenticolaceae bacterium]|nr:efflux RND transporter periplasmic adaptor subunit [Candidatus Polarisedimenticolaceae bacterium]
MFRSSILLAGLLGACVGCTGNKAASSPRGPEAVPVLVAKAVRKSVPVQLRAIGTVEAFTSVYVKARVGGELTRVHFEEGRDVAAGSALFTIDPQPYRTALAQAEARLARDRALLKKAESDMRRSAELVEQGFITREQNEQAATNAEALAATVRADEAALDQARLELGYCSIRSPIAGRTGNLMVHAGNLVKADDDQPLVVILQTRPIRVSFSAPEQYLAEIRRRSTIGTLGVSARERGEGAEPHAGKLEFLDNAVDATTGTIRLKALFPNLDGALWPGQFVELELTLSEDADALVVPAQAVQTGQQGNYVFVVGADGTAESRPVVVARSLGGETVLERGVEAGETVITDGQLRVVPGAKVEVKSSLAPS